MSCRYFLPFIVSMVVGAASAQTYEDHRRNEVVELVQLMGIDQIIIDSRAYCIKGVTDAWHSPSGAAKRGQGFYGKTPASPEWTQLLQLYSDYAESVCGRPKLAEIRELYVSFYLNALTADAVGAYKQFLSSPEGREVTATNPAFMRDLGPQIAGQDNELSAGAYEKLTQELNKFDTSKDDDRFTLIVFLIIFAMLFLLLGGFLGYWLAKRRKSSP